MYKPIDYPVVGADRVSQPGFVDVLDHLPTALALVSASPGFEVLYVNRAFTDQFGYVKGDIKTVAGWTELAYTDPTLSNKRFSSWVADVQRAQLHKAVIPVRESSVHCRDGSHRDVIAQTSLLNDCLLLSFTDITSSKRLAQELERKEKQFRGFVEHANDIIYTLDLQGCVTYMSPNCQSILGWDPLTMLGKRYEAVLHPDDVQKCHQAFQQVHQGNKLTGIEYRTLKGDGTWCWESSNIGPLMDEGGQVIGVIGVGRDIDVQKRAEMELRLSEARYRLLSDNARDVIWTIAADGRITYVSPSVELVRGYTPEEAMQQTLDQIHTPASMAVNLRYFDELLADVAAGRAPKPFRGEMEYLCKDGSIYWCDVLATPILAPDGSLVELLGVSRDISDFKRYEMELKRAKEAAEALNRALEAANEQLNVLSTTDSLTGLWNRRYFEQRVTYEMSRSNRYGQALSMLLFDIDHFKWVNDTHGHVAGDRVLTHLSTVTQELLRATDLPCRWGGEEFMVLMPNTGPKDAVTVAEKLRCAFARHVIPEVGVVTASFGVASYLPKESLDSWIIRTDDALYAAKRGGRDTVRLAHGKG